MTRRKSQLGRVKKAKKRWYSKPEKFVSMSSQHFKRLDKPKPSCSWSTPLGQTVFKDRRAGRKDRRTGQSGRVGSAKSSLFSAPEKYVAMRTERFKQLRKPKPKAAWSTPLGETGFRERRKKR